MPNTYYAPGEDRARRVQALFSRISRRYDLINDLQSFGLHRYWKQKVVQLAQLRPGEKALDLCTGTGDIAFQLSRPGSMVVGLDFTRGMLEQAARRDSPKKVAFLQGDALRLPFPKESFEVLTIGYGLRNLADFSGGLQEMLRVLKPGGRLLVLDFGKPPNSLWRRIYFSYLRLVVPLFGKMFCGDSAAYAYILESLEHYPAQEGVASELSRLGCRNSRVHNFLGGVMSINYAERS